MSDQLVTEYYLANNFTPKSGITPGSNNTLAMSCDQIADRYNVSIAGVTTTGTRLPGQSEITSISGGTTGDAYNITSTTASHNCIWNGNGYTITEGGVVCNTSPGPTTSVYAKKVTNAGLVGLTYATGGVSWAGLTPGTTYYSRVYVVTSQGTFYGNEVIFTTLT